MPHRSLRTALSLRLPIIQGPMTGADTPALAAAVSAAGGFGILDHVAPDIAAYAIERAGYRVTVALMLVFLLAVVERRSVIMSALLAAAMALGSFYLINDVLRVPLPVGAWGF